MAADRRRQVDDATVARLRLEALGLSVAPPGWVPETPPPLPADPLERVVGVPAPVEPVRPASLDGLARGWVQDRVPPWAHGFVERFALRSAVIAAVVVAALVVGVVALTHHGSGGGDASSYDDSSPAASASSATVPTTLPAPSPAGAAASIVVDVGGRVRKPGLVTLPAGARVADALAAAGGPLRQHEVATLNLAARVSDGELLLIGVKGPASAVGTDGSSDGSGDAADSSPAPVSLSAATIDQLETLPGVGPATAQKIIDWRTANNGFTSVSQLQQVAGIGPVKYAELAPLVTP